MSFQWSESSRRLSMHECSVLVSAGSRIRQNGSFGRKADTAADGQKNIRWRLNAFLWLHLPMQPPLR